LTALTGGPQFAISTRHSLLPALSKRFLICNRASRTRGSRLTWPRRLPIQTSVSAAPRRRNMLCASLCGWAAAAVWRRERKHAWEHGQQRRRREQRQGGSTNLEGQGPSLPCSSHVQSATRARAVVWRCRHARDRQHLASRRGCSPPRSSVVRHASAGPEGGPVRSWGLRPAHCKPFCSGKPAGAEVPSVRYLPGR